MSPKHKLCIALLCLAVSSASAASSVTNFFWSSSYTSNYIRTNILDKLNTIQQTWATTNSPTTTTNIVASIANTAPNFASMSLYTSQALALPSTAYNTVTNYQYGASNVFGFNLEDGSLTNTYAGYYAVAYQLSFVGGNSDAYEVSIFTNNTECVLISSESTFQSTAAINSVSGIGIIPLPANCRIDLRVKNATDSDDIVIERAQLSIR